MEFQDHNIPSLPSIKEDQMQNASEFDMEEIARWFGHTGEYITQSPSAEGFPVHGEGAYDSCNPKQHQQVQVSPRDDVPSSFLPGRLDMLYQ
jgi:hypothetical protein